MRGGGGGGGGGWGEAEEVGKDFVVGEDGGLDFCYLEREDV